MLQQKSSHAVPAHKMSFQAGQVVTGTITSTGPRGSKILLSNGIVGFMPRNLDPLHLQGDQYMRNTTPMTTDSKPQLRRHRPVQRQNRVPADWPELQINHVRDFLVHAHHADAQGPLLSAAHLDTAVLFKRAQQIAALCDEGEAVPARIMARNRGGVFACCLGLQGFIPKSYLPKKMKDLFDQQVDDGLVGTVLPVLIEEVVPEAKRVLLNSVAAISAKRAALQPTTLVQGVVQQVTHSHVWVELAGLGQDGYLAVLHKKDTSINQSFGSMQEVFSVGEPMTAMVLVSEEEGRRVALSTAHLEVAAGDMLRSKQEVYATAARQVQLVRQQMLLGQAVSAHPTTEAVAAPTEHNLEAPPAELHLQQQHSSPSPKQVTTAPRVFESADPFDAFSGYIPGVRGARLGAVVAAAVWHRAAEPEAWRPAAAAAAAAGTAAASPACEVLASIDQEQGWWAAGPLAWRVADEQEQWQAEQQLMQQQQGDVLAAAAAGVEAVGGGCDAIEQQLFVAADGLDGEQQWLQPPAHWEQAH